MSAKNQRSQIAEALQRIENVLDELKRRAINIERKENLLLGERIQLAPEQISSFIELGDQRYGNVTFAQHGDDLVLLNIFELLKVEKPTYLDIGAHHPFKISNTALLYQRGSRGVNVEANPNLIRAFETQRPEDINLNVAVSTQPGTMDFHMVDSRSGLNTLDPSRAAQLSEKGFKIQETIKVDCLTVEQIVEEHCKGVFPDLLSIDVEGLDLDILKSIRYEPGPKVIVVECNGPRDRREVFEFLRTRSYFLLFRASANLFFVKDSYSDMLLA